jgi:hypothetical protein
MQPPRLIRVQSACQMLNLSRRRTTQVLSGMEIVMRAQKGRSRIVYDRREVLNVLNRRQVKP